MKSVVTALVFLAAFVQNAVAAEFDIAIGYIQKFVAPPPTLSNLAPVPKDEGIAGFKLGIQDNATTGKFLNQNYRPETIVVGEDEDFISAAKAMLGKTPFLIVHAPAEDLLKIAALEEAKSAILLNASAPEIQLRNDGCRVNVLHTIPSRAMLSDALAQFAVKKRWSKWVMIEGDRREDRALADAFARSAKKFRLQLLARKTWKFDADMRRNAAQELPLFTQDFPEHDLLIVADELGDFARYIPYNAWLPRPIAGSEGLRPVTWSPVVEQHGAAQLQSRFEKMAMRTMRPIDYAAWAAVRTLGEAVTRIKSSDPKILRDYILSDEFELGGFKGRKLTFRKWNGQLRQPVPLAHSGAVAALAPLDGFLHQFNELDTLGIDKPESLCSVFGD